MNVASDRLRGGLKKNGVGLGSGQASPMISSRNNPDALKKSRILVILTPDYRASAVPSRMAETSIALNFDLKMHMLVKHKKKLKCLRSQMKTRASGLKINCGQATGIAERRSILYGKDQK